MTAFYLVRHGAIPYEQGGGDPGLSETGLAQARQTGRYLARCAIGALYSSPLRRALETARCIGTELGLPVRVDAALRERVNWGDDPAQTWEQFWAMWEHATRDRDWQPPVGDSSRAAGERLERFLSSLGTPAPQAGAPKVNFALVTHGGIIGDLLRNLFTNAELHTVVDDIDKMGYCSITDLERTAAGRYRLDACADNTHLVSDY